MADDSSPLRRGPVRRGPGSARPTDDAQDTRPEGEPADRWEKQDRAWEEKWDDDWDRDPSVETPEEQGEELRRPSPDYAARPKTSAAQAYNQGMAEAGPYLGLGIQIAASMLFFVGVGYAVDWWLDTSPWGVIVGAVLGFIGVIALVVQLAGEASGATPPPTEGGRLTANRENR